MTNIIRAYATLDPDVGYCVGYNYTIALLLKFIDDEEMAFWCFVGLMKLIGWRKFFIMEDPFFTQVPIAVDKMMKKQIPFLYKQLEEDNIAVCIGLSNLFAGEFLMSIGAKMLAVEESKLIFDYLLLAQNEKHPEKLLLDLLGRMLYFMEPKMMCMTEKERKDFMSQGKFVDLCLEQIPA